METYLNFPFTKKGYKMILIDSWYHIGKLIHICNNGKIQIGDIDIITSAYDSSELFVSRVRSKYIGHDIYSHKK